MGVYELGQFLVLTMADFAEQLYGWQDSMFGNTDGRLRLEGAPNPEPRYLWWVGLVSSTTCMLGMYILMLPTVMLPSPTVGVVHATTHEPTKRVATKKNISSIPRQ